MNCIESLQHTQNNQSVSKYFPSKLIDMSLIFVYILQFDENLAKIIEFISLQQNLNQIHHYLHVRVECNQFVHHPRQILH